ncbi:hypothetical protein [Vandammella animalimorsus]|uniref:hypothetical protein n=1 Tax=Vandammella animalimorsus TaxID=2029117 RepID=UPI00117767D8|nr:hypothetical protein [Vandammella animalimorsus]
MDFAWRAAWSLDAAWPQGDGLWGFLRLSIAAVFRSKVQGHIVGNACKAFNLASVFALHLRLLPRKTASQTQSQQPLARLVPQRTGPLTGWAAARLVVPHNPLQAQCPVAVAQSLVFFFQLGAMPRREAARSSGFFRRQA